MPLQPIKQSDVNHMFLGKPGSARVRAVWQFWRHPQTSSAAPSRLPPGKRDTKFALEGLGGRLKSFDIENACGHNATEGVSCCVVFGFRDCPGSSDGFMRESELLPDEP